ncbi:MAG: lipopolysaccharide assembly protein LapB [Luminiphilus sp.]|jgi:lipopolysaccharide biosynthesis regulator YciM
MAEPNTLLLVLLFLAVGAGWVLGRGAAGRDASDEAAPPSQYYLGLNFLLDGEQESALKAFSEALAVNAETFETHITFGSLLRKRGEVDNAIKIHQSLLSRSRLPDVQKNQAHLELAKDFIAAGLLDRAEQLLKDLIELSEDHRVDAKVLLVEVFEASRDWDQAYKLTESQLLEANDDNGQEATVIKAHAKLGHYCCEAAEDKESAGDLEAARELAERALNWTEESVWPHIILARLDQQQDQPRRAYERLITAARMSPERLPEFASQLIAVSDSVNARADLTPLLATLLTQREDPQLRVILADEHGARGDDAKALDIIKQGLNKKPSSRLLMQALTLLGEEVATPEIIEGAKKLASRQSAYLCGVCGFHGPSFYWQCPGCKSWDTLHRPVR